MTLAHRIIPTVLCSGTRLVKGRQFNPGRVVGHAAQAVKIHQGREVDELVLLDVTATKEGRTPDLKMIAELAAVCFMPLASRPARCAARALGESWRCAPRRPYVPSCDSTCLASSSQTPRGGPGRSLPNP